MDFLTTKQMRIRNGKSMANYKHRGSAVSTHKPTKLSSVQRFVGMANMQSPQPFKTIQQSKAPSAYGRNSRNGTDKGMNEQFLFLRKENHLNTCFNIRKNKLKEMTKVNKQIFQRITSQKSMYSSTDMNKSYKSIKEIKDRLSQSKMSQRSSLSRQNSRDSLKSSKSNRNVLKKKNMNPQIQINACSINRASSKDINKFKTLFQKDSHVRVASTIDNAEDVIRHNSYRKSGPYLRSVKVSGRRSFQTAKDTKETKGLKSDEGGILHRIVEDLKQNYPTASKKHK